MQCFNKAVATSHAFVTPAGCTVQVSHYRPENMVEVRLSNPEGVDTQFTMSRELAEGLQYMLYKLRP